MGGGAVKILVVDESKLMQDDLESLVRVARGE